MEVLLRCACLQNDARSSDLAAFASPRLSLTEEDCEQLAAALGAHRSSLSMSGRTDSPFGRLSTGSFDLLTGSVLVDGEALTDMTPGSPGRMRRSAPLSRPQSVERAGVKSEALGGLALPPSAANRHLPPPLVPVVVRPEAQANTPHPNPNAPSMQAALDDGLCVVCCTRPAVCFFNKTSAGHSEESVRFLLSSIVTPDMAAAARSASDKKKVDPAPLTGPLTVAEFISADGRYKSEYSHVNFDGLPEGALPFLLLPVSFSR